MDIFDIDTENNCSGNVAHNRSLLTRATNLFKMPFSPSSKGIGSRKAFPFSCLQGETSPLISTYLFYHWTPSLGPFVIPALQIHPPPPLPGWIPEKVEGPWASHPVWRHQYTDKQVCPPPLSLSSAWPQFTTPLGELCPCRYSADGK